MKFIKLNSVDGYVLYVRPDSILYFLGLSKGSFIVNRNSSRRYIGYEVKESADEVLRLIDESINKSEVTL